MATFDLTTKAGFPDFIDDYVTSYSASSPGSYSKNVIVDTHFANSFLFETSIRTTNTTSPDTFSITGLINLQESDSPTTGFTQIPAERIITRSNDAAFDLVEDYNAGTFMSQTATIGAYGNKRYVEIGIAVNASRTGTAESSLFVLTIYRKVTSVSPFSYLIQN